MLKGSPVAAAQARTGAPARATTSSSRRARIVRLVLVFISCVLVVDSLVGDKGLLETMRARRESDALVSDIARIKQENARLREEARRLREDPGAIEEVARRELGLMKPGELLFIIKDVASPSSAQK